MQLTKMRFSVLLGSSMVALALILPTHGDNIQDMDLSYSSQGIGNPYLYEDAVVGEMEAEKRLLPWNIFNHDKKSITSEG
jgi:hypothetical protein